MSYRFKGNKKKIWKYFMSILRFEPGSLGWRADTLANSATAQPQAQTSCEYFRTLIFGAHKVFFTPAHGIKSIKSVIGLVPGNQTIYHFNFYVV
jgi:hypothetical protein